jgi:hypothetical protein
LKNLFDVGLLIQFYFHAIILGLPPKITLEEGIDLAV